MEEEPGMLRSYWINAEVQFPITTTRCPSQPVSLVNLIFWTLEDKRKSNKLVFVVYKENVKRCVLVNISKLTLYNMPELNSDASVSAHIQGVVGSNPLGGVCF